MLLDPAVHREFERLKGDLQQASVQAHAYKEALDGVQYTQVRAVRARRCADCRPGMRPGMCAMSTGARTLLWCTRWRRRAFLNCWRPASSMPETHQDSKMGRKLVAKCQQLLQENQALGRELASSAADAVERQLLVARSFACDLQAALQEMRDLAVVLEEEQVRGVASGLGPSCH